MKLARDAESLLRESRLDCLGAQTILRPEPLTTTGPQRSDRRPQDRNCQRPGQGSWLARKPSQEQQQDQHEGGHQRHGARERTASFHDLRLAPGTIGLRGLSPWADSAEGFRPYARCRA